MGKNKEGVKGKGSSGRDAAPGQQEQVKIVNPSTGETKMIAKREWNRDFREEGWQRVDGVEATPTPRPPDDLRPGEATPGTEIPEPLEVEGSRPANEAF